MNVADQRTFRGAMFCMGAAVNITTTDGPAGRTGFTANAVCSVTGTPLALLVYLNRGTSVRPVFNESRMLCINTLSVGQESLSDLLDGKTPIEHRFAAACWQTGVIGCPQLEEVLVSLDCRINQVVSVGTRDILSCATEAIYRHATPYGLVWFDRSYHTLMRSAC